MLFIPVKLSIIDNPFIEIQNALISMLVPWLFPEVHTVIILLNGRIVELEVTKLKKSHEEQMGFIRRLVTGKPVYRTIF